MIKNRNYVLSSDLNPWFSLLLIIAFASIGLILGNVIGLLFATFTGDQTMLQLYAAFQTNDFSESLKVPLLVYQGLSSFFAFIFFPWLYLRLVEKRRFAIFFDSDAHNLRPIFMIVLLVISFMGLNSLIIQWNMELDFPDFMETFARNAEDQAKILTEFLTDFNNPWQFLLGFLVIAILPAIGEEFIFRGLLQNKIQQISKNAHFAVWLAAIIFGLVHLQFYGVLPRILLGALFGYLYIWSGSLLMPILAHLVNNGFTLLMIYLYDSGVTSFNIEEDSNIPYTSVVISIILTVLLIFYYRKFYFDREKEIE